MKTRTYVYGDYVIVIKSDDDDAYHRYSYRHHEHSSSNAIALNSWHGLANFELADEYKLRKAVDKDLGKEKDL